MSKKNPLQALKDHVVSLREKDIKEIDKIIEVSNRDIGRRERLIEGLERDNKDFFLHINQVEKLAAIEIYYKILKGEDASDLLEEIAVPALILFYFFEAHAQKQILRDKVKEARKAIKEIQSIIKDIKDGKHDKEYAELIKERAEEITAAIQGSKSNEGKDGENS
jgi:hypothetical protein